jgi:outer membrane protein OmpA-like peptidoglycan-associated protein
MLRPLSLSVVRPLSFLVGLLVASFVVCAQDVPTITSKYDFVPGEKVIFFDDFASEAVGDFPVAWNTTGSGEVVTTTLAEGRWFKITNPRGITTLADPIKLPENYTIEFDVIPQRFTPKNHNNKDFTFRLISTTKPKDLMYGLARPGEAGIAFTFAYNNSYATYYRDGTPDMKGQENEPKLLEDKKVRISIWVQKERIRLYVNETKLFDLPKAMSKTYQYNMIRFDNGTPLITNVRIATGLPDMRSKLLTEGKLVSYGIYFDVNKDVVKPESAGTLKMIADVLRENPGVRIAIVGHTDSDGDDASNLDLSKRRAAAVKTALVSGYGIDAARIETDGKGEKEPVATNDSATNKALNRRVEFLKR